MSVTEAKADIRKAGGPDAGSRDVDSGGTWRVEVLRDLPEVRRALWRWEMLERESADPDAAFQSALWCANWIEHGCDEDTQPRIQMIWRGETLVAILPLMLQRRRFVNVLSILGEPHTQIANALVRAGCEARDGLRLALAQAAVCDPVDIIALGPLPAGSPLHAALDPDTLTTDPAQYLSLQGWSGRMSQDDHLAKLSKNRRKDFRRKMRFLEARGEVRLETLESGTHDFAEAVRTALKMKREWLQREGIYSAGLQEPSLDAFLTALPMAEARFRVAMDVLSVAERPIALALHLDGHGTRHAWLSVFDPEFSTASPGMLLHQLAIAKWGGDGGNGYSFLGHPSAFKAMMTNTEIPLLRQQTALSARGRRYLALWENGAKPLIKGFVAKHPSLARILSCRAVAR